MTKDGIGLALDSSQLLSTLFALIPIPIAVADDRGRIVLSNSSFGDVFAGVASISTMPQYELDVPGRGTFEVQTLPLDDQGLKIVYAIDVRDRAQLRQQVTHLEKMAAIGRVVTGVAHELSNPLADIASGVPLIKQSNLDPAVREIVDNVFVRAERAGHLVQNLLILAGAAAPKYVGFDLNQVIRNVVSLRSFRSSAQQFDIALELDESVPKVFGDPLQIEQVVLTLLINAEDAVAGPQRRPGSIQLRTGSRAGRIQLHVSDNGCARGDAARVFEPHQNGVGLNVCAEIVKDHGGELYAWSAYGDGSTFTLELPFQPENTDSAVTVAGVGRSLEGKTVMVVDDDAHITEIMFDMLTRHGATIHIANSGYEAYERLRSKCYDLIICDQNMPGLSGESLYRLVKDMNPAATQRFLFATGEAITTQSRHLFSQAGVEFLRKPFKIHDLLEAVKNLLLQSQPQDS